MRVVFRGTYHHAGAHMCAPNITQEVDNNIVTSPFMIHIVDVEQGIKHRSIRATAVWTVIYVGLNLAVHHLARRHMFHAQLHHPPALAQDTELSMPHSIVHRRCCARPRNTCLAYMGSASAPRTALSMDLNIWACVPLAGTRTCTVQQQYRIW